MDWTALVYIFLIHTGSTHAPIYTYILEGKTIP